jgi:hypothetical protein
MLRRYEVEMAAGQTHAQPQLMPGVQDVQIAEPSVLAGFLGADARLREELPASETVLLPAGQRVTSLRRILVLVPDGQIDQEFLVSRVQRLVGSADLDVLYISLSVSPDEDWRAFRHLVGLLTASVETGLRVRTQLLAKGEWLPVLREIVQSGDLIVCHAEQSPRRWKDPHRTLGWWVASTLNVPVYVLSGAYVQARPYWVNRALCLVFRIIPILIVAGFFWIQVQIDKLATGLTHTLVMSVSVLVEFGLVFLWSYLLDRLNNV